MSMRPQMKNKYSFNVFWSDEDDAYIAVSPEFPSLSGLGDTPDEALAELEPVIDAVIQRYHEKGYPLPEPKVHNEYSGQLRVRFPKSIHAGLAAEAEREAVSLNTLIVTYVSKCLGATNTRDVLDDVTDRFCQKTDE